MRFGGIRKPRLGNSKLLTMARSKNWTYTKQGGGDGGSRNLNYSDPNVREWYAAQQKPLLDAGVEFWWNDEGETSFFTFYYWNLAQTQTLKTTSPNKRFMSINRAFTPGMSRMGLVIWTGDVAPQWQDLQRTPGYVLNWGLAGAACESRVLDCIKTLEPHQHSPLCPLRCHLRHWRLQRRDQRPAAHEVDASWNFYPGHASPLDTRGDTALPLPLGRRGGCRDEGDAQSAL